MIELGPFTSVPIANRLATQHALPLSGTPDLQAIRLVSPQDFPSRRLHLSDALTVQALDR